MKFFARLALLLALTGNLYAQTDCNCDLIITKEGTYDGDEDPVKPGGTICIKAGTYQYLRFRDYRGIPSAPIKIINCGGLVNFSSNERTLSGLVFWNSRNFIVSGSGDSRYRYGIKISKTGPEATALNITNKSSDCEIERVEVAHAGFAGIMIKTDPMPCDQSTWRGNFAMYNVKVHDNYVHDVTAEGLYIGNTSWNTGKRETCNGESVTMYPHEIYGLEIYDNIVERSGWDGIQYACSPNAKVHHNTVRQAGRANVGTQDNGFQIGGGVSGLFYANTARHSNGNGILMVGHRGNIKLYNNVIAHSGKSGFFTDERPGSLPDAPVYFINNTIVNSGCDGLQLYNDRQVNFVINNAIIKVGSDRYINQISKTMRVNKQNNYEDDNVAAARFVNPGAFDFRLKPDSPLVDQGISVSLFGINLDLSAQSPLGGDGVDIGAFELDSDERKARLATETSAETVLLKAYPSPVIDQLTVKLSNEKPITKLTLVDASGRVVLQHVPTTPAIEFKLDVGQLTKGIYVVRIQTADGKYANRILKQ